jgi:ActR/RegA family two-component response regulator
MSIDEVEALLIRKVLRRCDGNISQAAEASGTEPRRALSPH